MKRSSIINLCIIFCVLICLLLGCDTRNEHPKDNELMQNFQSHKDEFNQLLHMFQQDKSLGRVGIDFTRPTSFFEKCGGQSGWDGKVIEINEDRLLEYRKMFSNLNLDRGIEGYCQKDQIFFYASSMGLGISGSSKGYVYSKKDPSPIIDDLDKFAADAKTEFIVFRKIEGNWYLYEESN